MTPAVRHCIMFQGGTHTFLLRNSLPWFQAVKSQQIPCREVLLSFSSRLQSLRLSNNNLPLWKRQLGYHIHKWHSLGRTLIRFNSLRILTSRLQWCTRVGTLIVATNYLQLIQNTSIYMFRSFTVLQCSHQHCVQPVASDVEVVGYL